MRRNLRYFPIALILLTFARPDPSAAQEGRDAGVTAVEDRWEFVVAPYLLLPHMSGSVTVRALSVDVAADPGDIFSKLRFGAMFYLEAHNSTWAITLDGLFMWLKEDAERLPAEADMNQGAIELAGYRRLAPWAEALIGGRLNILGASITSEGPLGFEADDDKVWFDPLIGARFEVPRTGKWRLRLRGDIGGFGIGSDLAWQIYPVVAYRFSRLFALAAAYRVISMDYKTGSGSDRFEYDMRIFGPEVGLVFHF